MMMYIVVTSFDEIGDFAFYEGHGMFFFDGKMVEAEFHVDYLRDIVYVLV